MAPSVTVVRMDTDARDKELCDLENQIAALRAELAVDGDPSEMLEDLEIKVQNVLPDELEVLKFECGVLEQSAQQHQRLIADMNMLDGQPDQAARTRSYEFVAKQLQYYSHIFVKSWDESSGLLALKFFSYETRQPTAVDVKLKTASTAGQFTVESITSESNRLNEKINKSDKIQNLLGTSKLHLVCHHIKSLID